MRGWASSRWRWRGPGYGNCPTALRVHHDFSRGRAVLASAGFVPRQARRSHRAFFPKYGNLGGVKAAGTQDLVAVLAIKRRAASHPARRRRELDRQSERFDLAERRMLD